MDPMAPHWMGLWLALCYTSTMAAPFSLQIIAEGSGGGGEESGSAGPGPSAMTTNSSGPPDYQTTPPADRAGGESTALEQFVEFLHSNLLYILAAASLALFALLMVCVVVVLRRKLRINAYYPCSFPSKMYVEQRDKAGGVQRFDAVHQKASGGRQSEPVDFGQRLQQDIMRAAKGLRTPSKQPPQGGGVTRVSPGPQPTDGDPLGDKEAASLPEEDKTSRSTETAAGDSGTPVQGITPVQTGPQDVESEDPARSAADASAGQPDLRPSSQLIRCDSPTLQLITGEKTAF